MGCCLSQRIKDLEKDEPLLQEHPSQIDGKLDSSHTIDSIENGNVLDIKKNVASETNAMSAEIVGVTEETKESVPDEDESAGAPESVNPSDDCHFEEVKEQKTERKRSSQRQTDSVLDPQTLSKFEDHQQRMRDKKKLKKAIIIGIAVKSMDHRFPIFEINDLDQNQTVADLKRKIEEMSPDKIAPLRQRLIHRGRLMARDGRTLKQCNVRQNDTVMLVRSRRNQTVSSHSAKSRESGKRGRAMTLGAPQAMIRRSTTPDPGQTAQVY